MSKKQKHTGIQSAQVTFQGDTLTEQFENYLNGHKKVSDIIRFLSAVNARYIGLTATYGEDLSGIPEETQDEIIDFCEMFFAEFDDVTEEARYNNWGERDAFILRLGTMLIRKKNEEYYQEVFDSLTDIQKKEAQTLTDTIFKVRRDRLITFNWGDGTEQIGLDRTIPKQYLQECRNLVRNYCCLVIKNFGSVVVREYIGNRMEVYGYMVNPFGVWSPVPADSMKKASLTTPSGIELEPEEGVEYVCRMREKF